MNNKTIFWCKNCLNMSTRPRISFDSRGWCTACQWMEEKKEMDWAPRRKELEELLSKHTRPLIIAGGAGNEIHLIEGLKLKAVSAVATANLFNFVGDGLPNARRYIINSGENIAKWNVVN